MNLKVKDKSRHLRKASKVEYFKRDRYYLELPLCYNVVKLMGLKRGLNMTKPTPSHSQKKNFSSTRKIKSYTMRTTKIRPVLILFGALTFFMVCIIYKIFGFYLNHSQSDTFSSIYIHDNNILCNYSKISFR